MQSFLIPAALVLLLYAPGRYLLQGQAGGGAGSGSRLLREVLLSACCASWIGFVLAECGVYSLPALLAGLGLLSLLARWLVPRHQAERRYGAVDLAGIALVSLVWIAVAPPLDTRLMASDSAGYLASGVHLSRHGGLIIEDPTLRLLSPDVKRALFPSVAPDLGSPPYLRLNGSLVLRSLDGDQVLPAFHHLIAVWIAVFHGLAGSRATEWAVTMFAGLSVWAIVEFAFHLGGTAVALVTGVLLLCMSAQYWYARFLMPEVPGQFFLWGGLCALAFWDQTGRRREAILAGVAFGIAGLMRIENVAFVLIALPTCIWLNRRDPRRPGWALVGCGVLWLHAVFHLMIFRTHYFGNLHTLLAENLSQRSALLPGTVAGVAGGLAALLAWRWRPSRPPRWSSHAYVLVFAAAVCAGMFGDYRHGWSSLRLLHHYAGVPTVVGGLTGLLSSTFAVRRRGLAYQVFIVLAAIVLAQVLIQPHATPVPIWSVRRSVTVVLPALCIGMALLCRFIGSRWHWLVAAPILMASIEAQIPQLVGLREPHFYRESRRHVQAIAAMIPSGAVVLYDVQLTALGLAPTLWAEWDVPAYLLSPNDAFDLQQLVTALDGRPLYWLSTGTTPPPRADGVVVTPVALYSFLLATPLLDVDLAPHVSASWEYSIGVYALQGSVRESPITPDDRPGSGEQLNPGAT